MLNSTFTWTVLCFLSTSLNCINCMQDSIYTLNVDTYREMPSNIGTYTRNFLLERRRLLKPVLHPLLCERVYELSLHKYYRPSRGGQRKRRKIPVICSCSRPQLEYADKPTGVNHSNLRSLCRHEPVPVLLPQPSKLLTFGTANLRSLNSTHHLLAKHVHKHNYDFITLTETWVQDTNPHHCAELKGLGYNIHVSPRTNRPGGGIGLLVNKNYKVSSIDTPTYASFEHGMWSVVVDKTNLTVVTVYRPTYSQQNKYTVSDFCEEFSEFLGKINSSCPNLIISGDFNIHVNDPNDPNTLIFQDVLDTFSLKQHVTCKTHKKGNTLDLIITEDTFMYDISAPRDIYYISDHSVVASTINIPKPDTAKKSISYRNLKAIDHSKLNEDLLNFVKSTTPTSDFDSLVNSYSTELTRILDEHAPVIEKTIKPKPKVPWFDADTKTLQRKKRHLERKWRKTNNSADWENYKTCRNTFSKCIYAQKVSFYQQAVTACGKDTRRLFNTVLGLLNKSKDNPLPDVPSQDCANNFAGFFLQKIVNIRESLDHHPLFDPPAADMINRLSAFKQVSEDSVSKTLARMKPTTCALDPFPSAIIKQHSDILVPLLAKLVNLSFESSTFHQTWKSAMVLPLLKKAGLPLVEPNYRPVSNLQFVSKLVEKCALEQLADHFESNNLLPTYQSAYRPSFSTETAILRLHHDLLLNMENKSITAFVGLDLSAAFDTVHHGVLLSVLHNTFGVEHTALGWLQSYLQERSFFVHVNGANSDPKTIDFSVPQGSILGPVLYNAYSSTLQSHISNFPVDICGYADDHGIYKAFPPNSSDEKLTLDTLQNCLSCIHTWMCSNRLKMNASKTEFIYFGTRQMLERCNSNEIQVVNDSVARSNKIKYLGVWIDDELSFKAHVNLKCRTAYLNIRNIRTIRKYISMETCKLLVTALVLSHLDYCNAIFFGLDDTTLRKLQVAQNCAAKLILNKSRYDSSTASLKELHWLPIKQRIEYKLAILVFKALNGLAPAYLTELLNYKSYSRVTRASEANKDVATFDIPFCRRKTLYDRSFAVAGPTIWNKLPKDIRKINDLEVLKSKLKTHFFKIAFNS